MDYLTEWNLASIPDRLLRIEWARRNSLRRKTFAGGRPPRILACPFCGNEPFTAIDLRAHSANCRQERLRALGRTPFVINPRPDDPYNLGFVLLAVTREIVRVQKIGTTGSENLKSTKVEFPTTAVRSIAPPRDQRPAAITLAGAISFSRSTGWIFTPPQKIHSQHYEPQSAA